MNKFTIFNINIFTTNLFISLQFINLIYYYCNNFLDCDIKNKYFTRLKTNDICRIFLNKNIPLHKYPHLELNSTFIVSSILTEVNNCKHF